MNENRTCNRAGLNLSFAFMKAKRTLLTGAFALALAASAEATVYSGNGNTGFGGPIGTGSLTLTDDGTTVSGTITKGSGGFNDVLVIYIDTGSNSGILGTTIAAGQTSELNVVFAPKATGSVTGKVTITSNATNSPNSVSVSGTGVSSTSHSVTLSWAASSSSGVVGYYVYRSTTSGSSYTRINSSALTTLKYTDGSVSAGETYYYVVTAVNSSGTESAKSAQVTAVVP